MTKKDRKSLNEKSEGLLNRIPRHSETGEVLPNTGEWMTRHFDAVGQHTAPVRTAYSEKVAHERALVLMLQGWLAYADAHKQAFEGSIADDGFLGPEWLDIGKGIRALLNGEAGRLDCGTLDGVILDGMRAGGVDLDKEGL